MSAVFENYSKGGPVVPLDDRFGEIEARRNPAQRKAHYLDSEPVRQRFRQLNDWWQEAREVHAHNRYEQAVDEDFYDGLQWKDDDVTTLAERGQAASVFNVVAQHVNWILGTERRTRVDFRVFSRDGNDTKSAEIKTSALKYVGDVNKSQYHRSDAFADAVKAGVGWLEAGVRTDPYEEPLYSRRESWRYMWWDALAQESDLSDARYIFRVKWVDTDIAEHMFPDRAEQVRQSARVDDLLHFEDDSEIIGYTGLYGQPMSDRNVLATGTSFMDTTFNIGNRRNRNKLIECWYRMPAKVKVIKPNNYAVLDSGFSEDLAALARTEFDPNDEFMAGLERDGLISVYDGIRMKVRCAIWSGSYMLQDVESIYWHDRFPFTPIWCYRRARDNMPYGVIRNMRDPQEDLNKRRSKALFLLSASVLIADDDAFEDWDEAADEAARPDAVLKKRRGSDVKLERNLELAEAHADLMRDDISFLQAASGVTEENRGEVTNTNSGAAIDKRQRQGSVVTAVVFDNLRRGIQLHGEMELSNVEQFMAEPKIIRLSDRRGVPQYTRINYPQVDPATGQIDVLNPIVASQAQFVVDTEAFKESTRAAMFQTVMDSLQTLDPEVQFKLLDLAYELSDVPNKDEFVRRIRALNGQVDPDDPDREALELLALNERKADAALAKRERLAEIAQKEGTAEKARAGATVHRGETMGKAVEAMALMAGDPDFARAVDILVDAWQREGSPTNEAAEAEAAGPDEAPAAALPAPAGEGGEGGGKQPAKPGAKGAPVASKKGGQKKAPGAKPKKATPGTSKAGRKDFAGST